MAAQTPELPSTIKAWRFHTAAHGAHKHLQLEDIPMPEFNEKRLPPNSSLIKVLAATVNPIDVKMAGIPIIGRFTQPMPAVVGRDASGIVVKTTDPSLRAGQLVACRLSENQAPGVMAEYIVVPGNDKGAAAAVPAGVSAVQAATVGTTGATALQAIARRYDLGKLDGGPRRIFINGGSGGTGTYQIQVAKALGFHVTASCSGANAQLCRDLGADEVLDYKQAEPARALAEQVRAGSQPAYDLAVDNVGISWERYRAADEFLAPGGVYVQVGIGFRWAELRSALRINCWPSWLGGGRRAWSFLSMRTDRADMERVLGWMGEGKVKVPIDREFEFGEVPQAYETLLAGRARGKIVVRFPALEENATA
ncbi:uncharacterized protein E0L32_008865 [Thyridium curvatum]|uniref:Enoyl reductase (ER) domain-containing protein n=1 Tax=Thyridium curvatum TaxID=1093900 RepID=A0A507APZ6_9PEZI|nr:uncharacterized protein E0L32_008865 [Thyridium curvatum]TPX09843.1 hypothetical protein E0L32_008865 [Thyridium curvatum]